MKLNSKIMVVANKNVRSGSEIRSGSENDSNYDDKDPITKWLVIIICVSVLAEFIVHYFHLFGG